MLAYWEFSKSHLFAIEKGKEQPNASEARGLEELNDRPIEELLEDVNDVSKLELEFLAATKNKLHFKCMKKACPLDPQTFKQGSLMMQKAIQQQLSELQRRIEAEWAF